MVATMKPQGNPQPPARGKDLAKILKEHGFTVNLARNGHYKAKHRAHPEKAPISFPSTPSDNRWHLNIRSFIKKIYGIDIRKPPKK